ncbi:hypothetical protein [Bradyrhizobium liaoningense]|nr:hypothetical protein [Bradyrhizobium liaoningense]
MAAAVPAISWLKQSVFFFLLGAVLLIGLAISFWLRQDRRPSQVPAGMNKQAED